MSGERANGPILGDERNAIGAGQEMQSRAPGGLATTAFGLSDIGCQRSVNQDTLGNRIGEFTARTDDLGLLYAIADGMGGHARGEVASAIAIHELFARYYASDKTQEVQQNLARVLTETNVAVYQAGRAAGGGTMGTTLTTILLRDNILYVGNVGDSRTYLIRGGKIKQLSHDHSLIGEQLRSGLLTEAQARSSSIRNVITRAVGYREAVEPDTFAFTVQVGDILLLCSDGLHGLVENDELARYLSTKSLAEATTELVALARDRGGPDNITALAIRIDEIGTPAAVADDDRTTESFVLPDDSTAPLPMIPPGRTDEIIADPASGELPEDGPTQPNPLIVGAAAAPAALAPSPAPPRTPPPGAIPAPAIAPPPHSAPPPKRQARPPIWLFIAIPIILILLVAGVAAVFVSRGGPAPAGTSVPIASPVAPTATVAAPAGSAPAAAAPLGTPTTQATVVANLGSPTATAGLVQVSPPTAATGTPSPPALPRGIASATATSGGGVQVVTISGTILINQGVQPPQNFPANWSVVLYDWNEWQQQRQRAVPKKRAPIKAAPLGVGFAFTLEYEMPATQQGGERLLFQVEQAGNARIANTDELVELVVTRGEKTPEHKVNAIRISGFPPESETGPSQTPRPGGRIGEPVAIIVDRAGRSE